MKYVTLRVEFGNPVDLSKPERRDTLNAHPSRISTKYESLSISLLEFISQLNENL